MHRPHRRYDDNEAADEEGGAGGVGHTDHVAEGGGEGGAAGAGAGTPRPEPPTSAAAVEDPVALMQQMVAEAAGMLQCYSVSLFLCVLFLLLCFP